MRGLFLAAVLIFHGCTSDKDVVPRDAPIILISIDTLRSDRLPVYGYDRVATPHIDAFRGDSVLYERAYSHCPLTLPSHASMLTGLLPSEHGVRDNIGYRLADDIPTAAELLKKNGYATGAAISAFVLRREAGLARGFDFYDDEVEPLGQSNVIGRVQRPGNETIAVAERWLDQATAKPFFLFLHLYDPHTPYEAPEPFLGQYKDRYDGEIAWVDHLLGRFFESLKRRGLYDRALIVVTSDHGEGLNDHGEEEHGIFLYREALQVPMLVKLPKSRHAGATVRTPVQLVDVFPTILAGAGDDTRAPKMDPGARSLLAFVEKDEGSRPIYAETYYPRFHFGWSDLHSLIDGDHHYIRAPIPELYNLAADPGETKNVLEHERRTYFAMREAIEPYVKRAAEPAPIDPEEAARFAALGYVGSNVSTVEGDELPDPKTTVDVFRQIRLAYTFFRDYRLNEALKLTDELLEENERIVDLWDLKSKILSRLGRTEDAVEAARNGLRHQPQSVPLIITVANLSILLDDLEQAEKHAELLLNIEPPRAHDILARVAIERGDYERATTEAKKVLETGHDPAAGLMLLGLIEKQRNDLPAALAHLDKAVESSARKKRPPANLHLYRGDVLARLNRPRDAERDFRREIAAYPSQTEAYASLILLLAAEGNVQEATRLVFDVIRTSPTPPGYVAVAETLQAIGDERGAMYWTRQGLQKYPEDVALRRLATAVRGS